MHLVCHIFIAEFPFFFIYSEIGFRNQSKFDVKVQRKERLLRQGIVSYIGASEFTAYRSKKFNRICVYLEPEIALILLPITIMPRHQERTSHFAGKDTWSMSPWNLLLMSLDLATVPRCPCSTRRPLQRSCRNIETDFGYQCRTGQQKLHWD
jgi:hypothetical protein